MIDNIIGTSEPRALAAAQRSRQSTQYHRHAWFEC